MYQRQIQDFKLGGTHLKKLRRAENFLGISCEKFIFFPILGGTPLCIYMYCIYITTTTLHVFRIHLNCALDINVSKCSDCMVNVRAIAS